MAVCDAVDTLCRTEAIVNQSLSHSSFLSSSIIDSGDLTWCCYCMQPAWQVKFGVLWIVSVLVHSWLFGY